MAGFLLLLPAAIFWGMNFQFASVLLQEFDLFQAGFWRFLIGALAIQIFLLFKNGSGEKAPWGATLSISFVGIFGFNVFFFYALSLTTALDAALIISLNPFTTSVLGRLIWKDSLDRSKIMGLAISFVGVLWVITKGDWLAIAKLQWGFGNSIMLLANLLFALHHLWIQKWIPPQALFSFTNRSTWITSIAFLIGVWGFSGTFLSVPQSYPAWGAASFLGIFGTAAAFILWNKGLKAVGAGQASAFLHLVPLTAGLTAPLFGHPWQSAHFWGGSIIVLGLAFPQLLKPLKHPRFTTLKFLQ